MADKVYIQNGGIFLEPDSATEAVFVSNGQIHYQPAGAVAGDLPKINGITSYTSINGVSSFTSINGVT